jgi:hypothetical protein
MQLLVILVEDLSGPTRTSLGEFICAIEGLARETCNAGDFITDSLSHEIDGDKETSCRKLHLWNRFVYK